MEFYLSESVEQVVFGLAPLVKENIDAGRLKFFVNGRRVESERRGEGFEYSVDMRMIPPSSTVKITIEVDKSYSPYDLKINDDKRNIGFGLKFISFD